MGYVFRARREPPGPNQGDPMRKTIAGAVSTVIAVCALAFAGQAMAQEKLTVWWVKGFYKSEDDALFEAIKKYEAKSGVKVELSQYPIQDMIPKTVARSEEHTSELQSPDHLVC